MSSPADDSLGVLRHRDFACYVAARFLSTIAIQMQTVAVGWQIYAITRDPLDLGFVGLSQFLPFVVLILPAGQVADHYDRRRIVAACFAIESLCAASLLYFTLSGLSSAGAVFGAMGLFGVARAFMMPTGQALVPNLVPRESWSKAVALNSSIFQCATVAGPALGGLLYLAGPATVYATAAGLFLGALGLTWMIRAGGRTSTAREPATWRTLLSGLAFVRSKPVVLGAISLDLFAVLFGGATALLPIYASDILHVGPGGLGLLRASPAIGAALCGMALAIHPLTRNVGRSMFGGVMLFGLATVIFGLSTNFWLSILALATLGASDMVSVYIRNMLVQIETPDEIRGRVSAVNAVFIGASNELGEFESGVTAAWWGTVPAVVVGGIATMLVAATWTRLFPVLWHMERFPSWKGRG